MTRIILVICLGLIMSCKPEPAPPQQELHDKVIEIHDEAMVAMSPIYKKIKEIRFLKDSTSLERKDEAQSIIIHLIDSEEAMMDWMAEWEAPQLDSASEATMTYLKNEEKKIVKIHEDILNSVASADSFLLQHKSIESI